MWSCKAWLIGRGVRCNAPTGIVDAALGGPCCEAHRRGPAQQMLCCRCAQQIAPGERWEYWSALHAHDGRAPVICGACVTNLIRGVVGALRRVPPEAWGA